MRRRLRGAPLLLILLALVLTICTAAVLWEVLAPSFPDSPAGQRLQQYALDNGLSAADYPKSLVALLERNPEAEQFVLEYPTASKTVFSVDLTPYIGQTTVPLLMQWDQRWGYLRYGSDVAGLTGCGPLCLSMVGLYLTGEERYAPASMLRFASENGYYVSGSGSSWTLISEGAEKLGLQVTELPLDENRIRKKLEAGIPVICVVGPGDFTTAGHFLVLTGWENGMLRINDPNSRANSQKLWRYADIEGQIRNLWAVENP